MSPLGFAIASPVGAFHPLLPASLRSLASQPVDLEAALLDASGDDRVSALADEHGSLFAYRRHAGDDGQSAAIIEGWSRAAGEILGWLNADDILFPGALAKVRAAFEADSALDVVYGHSVIIDDQARMAGYHWAVEPPGPRLLEAGVISQPSCFFRRSAYERAGGLDKDLHYTMDWDLWIRLYKSGARFGFIDAPLSLVLWGRDTKTASFNERRRRELKTLLERHAPEDKKAAIFRSFAIHNAIERIPSTAVRNWIVGALAKNRKNIFGVNADGRLDETASIHFANISDRPQTTLRLEFDNLAAVEKIECGAQNASLSRSRNVATLRFDPPLAVGAPVEITLAAANNARFLRCCWNAG